MIRQIGTKTQSTLDRAYFIVLILHLNFQVPYRHANLQLQTLHGTVVKESLGLTILISTTIQKININKTQYSRNTLKLGNPPDLIFQDHNSHLILIKKREKKREKATVYATMYKSSRE